MRIREVENARNFDRRRMGATGEGTRPPRTTRPVTFDPLEPRALLSTTYYVSTAGDDAASGSAAAPFRTLQHAADVVAAGDTVVARAGQYAGFYYYGSGGTATAPITFRAEPGATINHVAPSGNAGIQFENGRAHYFVIDGFDIAGLDGSMEKAGIRLIEVDHFTVQNCTVTNPTGRWGIFTSNSSDGMILNNTSHDNGAEHGLYISGASARLTVRGNTFYGNNWDGIHVNAFSAAAPATGLLIDGNRIYGNQLSGMDIEGMQDSVVCNNVIYDNAKHGIVLHHLDDLPNYPSTGNVLANNTIVANRYAIAMAAGGNDRNTVFNNILLTHDTFHGGALAVDSPATALVSDYNLTSDSASTAGNGDATGNLSQWQSLTGQDAHSVLGPADLSALFVNPGANDFHLAPASPATDAGTPALGEREAPPTDIDGNLRPHGFNWDIGAYEDPSLPDLTPPLLKSIRSLGVIDIKARINWDTNEPSDAQVQYGTTTDYGQSTPIAAALSTTHAFTLTGLTPDTLYHYRVLSRDALGNLATSADFTFTTLPLDDVPPSVSAVSVSERALDGARIRWTTGEPADTQVEYGLTTDYGNVTPLSDLLATAHDVQLSGLAFSSTYHFRVRSRDDSGNLTVSEDFTFTTLAPGELPAGAITFWHFDDGPAVTSLSDATGNGNTATPLNGPTFVYGRDPAAGYALALDGEDDQVVIPRTPALEPAQLTLSAWIRLEVGFHQAQWATIIKKTYADDGPPIYGSYSLSISPDGQSEHLGFFTGHPGGENSVLISPNALLTGRWIHVAGTYDPATGAKRLYVDGQLVASQFLNKPIAYDPSPTGDVYLGQDPGPFEAYNGLIDDVGIWDRALAPAEIRALAYNPPPTVPPAADLTATRDSYHRISLRWTYPANEHSGFVILRTTDGTNWYRVGAVGRDDRTFVDAVNPSTDYQYAVYAFNLVNFSDPSNVARVSTKAGGDGLRAEYFATPDLSGPAVSRTDPVVDFDWNRAAPVGGVPAGAYSVRWSGALLAFDTGVYTFFSTADDGVRLWVDGQLVIDHWADRPRLIGDANDDGVVNFTDYQILERQVGTTNPQTDFNADGVVDDADFQLLYRNLGKTLAATLPVYSGTIALRAGRAYDVRLEYYQDGGIGSARLAWLLPSGIQQLVPKDQLFTGAPPRIVPDEQAPLPTVAPTTPVTTVTADVPIVPALTPAPATPTPPAVPKPISTPPTKPATKPTPAKKPVFSVTPIKRPAPPTPKIPASPPRQSPPKSASPSPAPIIKPDPQKKPAPPAIRDDVAPKPPSPYRPTVRIVKPRH